ncbi:MAG: hypothetical protein WBA97_32430 [Actinophytocola sp.]|uniref:hypothetical protein n=1 Tax=Actinophytocola sp. TaxID=1872138 RepID=UPI003C751D4A
MARAIKHKRSARRALASARILDQVVESQLPLVARLPEGRSRTRAADFLAELILLSQAYRHHAEGWISRRELEQRGHSTMRRISSIRARSSLSSTQFTEQD